MNEITEKKYPIRKRWVIKSSAFPFFLFIIYLGFTNYLFIINSEYDFGLESPVWLILLFTASFIWQPITFTLQRLFFHYSLEDRFLTIQQGVISKQQRQLPYGVIQNLLVQQDLLDRFFGLASLRIENAAQGGLGFESIALQRNQRGGEIVGVASNAINIPGLNKRDAEMLKNLILQKMKENPSMSNSGL